MDTIAHFEIHADDPLHRTVGFHEQSFGWSVSQMGDEGYWLATTQGGPTEQASTARSSATWSATRDQSASR